MIRALLLLFTAMLILIFGVVCIALAGCHSAIPRSTIPLINVLPPPGCYETPLQLVCPSLDHPDAPPPKPRPPDVKI